jgi:hypothetical protein
MSVGWKTLDTQNNPMTIDLSEDEGRNRSFIGLTSWPEEEGEDVRDLTSCTLLFTLQMINCCVTSVFTVYPFLSPLSRPHVIYRTLVIMLFLYTTRLALPVRFEISGLHLFVFHCPSVNVVSCCNSFLAFRVKIIQTCSLKFCYAHL